MLTAMILLGLLPLAALPFLGGTSDSDTDDTPPVAEASEGTQLFHDHTGANYTFVASDGEETIADFVPGEDTADIDLTGLDGEIYLTTEIADNAATLHFNGDSGTSVSLRFNGLTEVPSGDVALRLSDPGEGTPVTVMLQDILGVMNETNDAQDAAADIVARGLLINSFASSHAISGDAGLPPPADDAFPSKPANLVDGGMKTPAEGADPGLPGWLVADPLPQPETTGDAPVPRETLGPGMTVPDADPITPDTTTEHAGSTIPAPNQTHKVHATQESTMTNPQPPVQQDTSPNDDEQDLPATAGDWATDPHADLRPMPDVEMIEDFIAGEDILRMHVETTEAETDVDVSPSPDGGDAWVSVNGVLVAILRGAPTATIWDIYIEPERQEAVA